MVNDDDIAASLPDPPPPAPVRREAAIEAALRRFDGQTADATPPSAQARPRPLPWWRELGRPQVGVMISAALVALVGVPAIWMSIENCPAAHAPNAQVDQAIEPTPMPVQPQPQTTAPSAKAPDAQPARPRPAPATQALAPPAAVPAAPELALAQAPPPPPAPAELAAQDIAVSARRAEAPAAPALDLRSRIAAAKPATAEARADIEDVGIVVTGARIKRRSDRRGDWNACTVDDPARDLSGCKRFFDTGAKGNAGRAATHIADGLTRAWEGDDDAAVAAFDQAIATAPRNGFAYLNRGLAHQRQGEVDRAIADLDQAIRHDPGAARNYYVRSQLHRQRGDTRRARIDAEHAVDIDPRYADLVR